MTETNRMCMSDVVNGLENALETVKKLYTGTNSGKLMIRVEDV